MTARPSAALTFIVSQKYLGDGPKLVRELFRVADEHAPSIVFIDEIDAIGTKRYVPCSFLCGCPLANWHSPVTTRRRAASARFSEQCLSCSPSSTVSMRAAKSRSESVACTAITGLGLSASSVMSQVIMATNRIETLDPALLRPGRIDRKIEFPLPDINTKRGIFKIHTAKMACTEDVDLEEFITSKDDLSGADVKVRPGVSLSLSAASVAHLSFVLASSGDLHRGRPACAARAPHEGDAGRLPQGQGDGALPQEGQPPRGPLLVSTRSALLSCWHASAHFAPRVDSRERTDQIQTSTIIDNR